MVTTVFSDEIINPTELKKNQRHWLDKARNQPVTVKFGDGSLAIVDREVMKNLYAEKHYAELLVKYCQEEAVAKNKSDVFPWLSSLDDEEKKEFHDEFLEVFSKAIQTNSWSELKELFEDWEATAEAEANPEVREALLSEENPEDYVTLEPRRK